MGQRIVVPPGSYTVRVGSSPLNQMLSIPVTVTAGNTAVLIQWGALVIEVVDGNNIPHRGSYELIQVSDKQPYAVGFGADTLSGERIRTLLVAPGLFRDRCPGDNLATARARTLHGAGAAGRRQYYKLVLDPDDGCSWAPRCAARRARNRHQPVGLVRRYSIGPRRPISSTHNVAGANNRPRTRAP